MLVPLGVEAVTLLAERVAPFVIAQFALMVVAVVPVTVQVTPAPDIVTAVAPLRLVPVSVTGTVVLCEPVVGLIDARVAPCTVNAPVRLGVPAGVVTVTFLDVSPAVTAIAQLALTVVAVGVPVTVQVTPAPDIVTAVAPLRSVPVRVTGTVVPRTPVLGATEVNVGPVTANAAVRVAVPKGVVTLTFLVVSPAPAVITQDALTVVAVGVPEMVQVILPAAPLMVTAVAPLRLVPVRVTGTVDPRAPDVGLIDVSVGTDAAVTVNCTVLVVPAGVVTLTVLPVRAAVPEIVNVAVTVLSFTTVRALTVMPPPDTLTAVAPVNPVPLRVTGTLVSRWPDVGVIEASVGPSTVNVTLPVVPPPVVMVTFLTVSAAVFEMVKVAVTEVALTTVRLLTVTPVPETLIVCVPDRFVPVRVTLTAVPRRPDVGAIDVRVGGATAPWNSKAPTSNLVRFEGSGRGFPKKSVCGCGCPTGT